MFSPVVTPETIASFSHPDVVELLGVCVAPPSLGVVLELCDGSLCEEIQWLKANMQSYTEYLNQMEADSGGYGNNVFENANDRYKNAYRQRLHFFVTAGTQCATAVQHVHKLDILHRDIKSLNFLIKKRRRSHSRYTSRNSNHSNRSNGSNGSNQSAIADKTASHFIVKLATGFPGNPKINLASSDGCFLAFCSKTGVLTHTIFDVGYLTL